MVEGLRPPLGYQWLSEANGFTVVDEDLTGLGHSCCVDGSVSSPFCFDVIRSGQVILSDTSLGVVSGAGD